jgi:signal transduction histidine kinase
MEAGGRVRISTRLATGAGSPRTPWIEVVIEDDGPGIPPAELSRIFDPFYTTRNNKRGMGMGLKICRDIVEAHGGRLRLESDGQHGTRVIIQMPASDRPAAADEQSTTT